MPSTLTAWHITPATAVLVVVVLALSVGYVVAARRIGLSRLCVAAWLGAGLVVVATVAGPIGVYGERLFWVHMIAHLALIMVVPVLLVWARPLRLLRDAGGARTRAGVDRFCSSRLVRRVAGPPVALAFYAAVVVLTHLTGFQDVSLADPVVRGVELALYVVSGWLLFWPLVGEELSPWPVPHVLRFVLLALGMGVDTLTGVVLMLTPNPVAPGYGAAHLGWGPDVLADQEIAGAVMWFGGDLLMMLLMIVVGVRWGRAPAADQGMGSWIEGARRRSLLGPDDLETADGPGVDVDTDDESLARYNRLLAALHSREERS